MTTPDEAGTAFSAAHFVYIPLCVLLGIVVGWLLGSRSSREEIRRLRRLLDEDDQRRAGERAANLDSK
jgi:F420-0:gamma-glutamyl ligase-like protein